MATDRTFFVASFRVVVVVPTVQARFIVRPDPVRIGAGRSRTHGPMPRSTRSMRVLPLTLLQGDARTAGVWPPIEVPIDLFTYQVVQVNRAWSVDTLVVPVAMPTHAFFTLCAPAPITVMVRAVPGVMSRTALPNSVIVRTQLASITIDIGRVLTPGPVRTVLSLPQVAVSVLFNTDTGTTRTIIAVEVGDVVKVEQLRLSGSEDLKTLRQGSSVSILLFEDPD